MLKHILMRVVAIILIPIVLWTLFVEPSGGSDAMGNGMARAFATLYTILISAIIIILGLIIDIIVLYKLKQEDKIPISFIILLFTLSFFIVFLHL